MSAPHSRRIPASGGSHPASQTRANTVNPALTPNRRTRPVVENDDYAAFTRRVIAAHARRIAAGDVEGLPALTALENDLQRAIHTAVTGLRAQNYSWAEIASRIGITRQAAHQRWGTTST